MKSELRCPIEPTSIEDFAGQALWERFLEAEKGTVLGRIEFFKSLPKDQFRDCLDFWIAHCETVRTVDNGSYDYTFWQVLLPIVRERL